MPHAHDQHEDRLVLHFVENSIIPDANAVGVLAAAKLSHSIRAWVIGERLNFSVNAPQYQHVAGKGANVSLGGSGEFDSIDLAGQLPQPELSPQRFVGDALIRLGQGLTHGLEVGAVLERLE